MDRVRFGRALGVGAREAAKAAMKAADAVTAPNPASNGLQATLSHGESSSMKNFLFLVAGIAAATACLLITRPRSSRSIDDLAHDLQGAWADHHTVA